MTSMDILKNGPNARRGDARCPQEDRLGTNVEDRPTHSGIALCAALILAAFCRWLSNRTAGDEYGGWFDLGGVSHVSWFAYLFFAAAAIMVTVAAVLRMVDESRGRTGTGHVQQRDGGGRTEQQAPDRASSLISQDPAVVVARCGGQQLLPDRPAGDESLAGFGAGRRWREVGLWACGRFVVRLVVKLCGSAPSRRRGEGRRPRALRGEHLQERASRCLKTMGSSYDRRMELT
jgi:hypothetical protein